MTITSYLTGPQHLPDSQLREVVLEEHLECGCQCDQLAALNCPGRFNRSTCECHCDHHTFGQVSHSPQHRVGMFIVHRFGPFYY